MLDSLKMPFFTRKWLSSASPPEMPKPGEFDYSIRRRQQQQPQPIENESNSVETDADAENDVVKSKTPLVFHCQQAHGSPTGLISDFKSVKELYQKIADCYDISADEILFCTLNTHKVDMTKLLGAQIGLDDFIFAHLAGQPKEIEMVKTEDSLGLTITDNGAGKAFVKKLKEGSLMAKLNCVSVGDHIERINGEDMKNKRHFEVARHLKDIAIGTTFIIRLVEPLRAGFANVGPRSGSARGSSAKSLRSAAGNGKQTLRLRSTGNATVEAEPDEQSSSVIERINALLESFLGINDTDLATTIYERGRNKRNTHEFALAIDSSDLAVFGFTDEFIFELWGVVTDANSGRLLSSLYYTHVSIKSATASELSGDGFARKSTTTAAAAAVTVLPKAINGDVPLRPCTAEMQF